MTQFGRTLITLEGWAGAPGVNVLHWCAPAHLDISNTDVNNFHEIVADMLTDVSAAFYASGVVVSIDPQCTIHDADTGTLVGVEVSGNDPFTMTGSGDGEESRATQIGMKFLTSDINRGRRVQGRMFFGPVGSSQLDGNGQVASATRASLIPKFDGLVDPIGPRLVVWSRPTPGNTDGIVSDVQTVDVSQMPFVLRGRRN
jgi:hypothetical protein